MTLLINGIILLLILGYAAFTIIRFFKKSKQGKCAACEINKGCGHSMPKAMKKHQNKAS
ncbi:FeoB-associated Cys-rich membrane protein [Staphylococcus sp. IVB6181]|uniref:FeoB-associated Cys-rich membrane protein n=1 Tax=Staphylococcus TaxID=1279 RepID=UPI000D02D5AD|nr:MULTISPECIES: FeoB-associated Cys-rich membrane protein [Staphylococcus]MCD8915898.1 FeoB-associated Cys-rich membrane protein [Staphylococcus simulans]UXV35389.1 FeoB-associated Cys-rich membrane protein [Staphylococcus sp. IVB6181]